jgi:alkylation response protein AidB-like acyl-CoA dehydrogenase
MRFAFTDEQLLFRDAVRDLLTKECTPADLRSVWDAPADAAGRGDPLAWSALASMGVIGLTAPERVGGLGLGMLDLVLLLEESGRVALPGAIVETTAVASPLLAALAGAAAGPDDDRVEAWLGAAAAGDLIVTVSLDGAGLLPWSRAADLLLVADHGRLLAVERAAAALTPQASVDAARDLATFSLAGAEVVVLADGEDAAALMASAFDRGALGAAAQLLGLADEMLRLTVDYVKERRQFGVPIGSFQAIKHHLADALLALEFARPVVYHAAYALDEGSPDAARDVSMAKCYASDAAATVARKALQCHGAIGYTIEYDLHMWMKRAWALGASWGDASFHRARVADSILGPSQ